MAVPGGYDFGVSKTRGLKASKGFVDTSQFGEKNREDNNE
jgi:hypothetical protein